MTNAKPYRLPHEAAAPARFGTMLAAGVLLAVSAAAVKAAPETSALQPTGSLLAQATTPPATTAPPAGAAGSSATAPRKASNPDQKFAEQAAIGGITEVEAGKMAQTKASAAPVKSFAEHMVADHTKANDQLKQLALSKGVMLPTSPDRSHARDLEKAGKLQGADFDRQYMKMMVADHKKTVSLFEKEAKNGKDPELKAFASTLLPDLQKHLQMAQTTERDVKSGGIDAKAPAMTK